MDEATYCRTVCKAKCCRSYTPEEGIIACPRLGSDNSCNVYEQRFHPHQPDVVAVGTFRSKSIKNLTGEPALRPFLCWRIQVLIDAKKLPEEVAKQCCIVHPELLDDES